MDLAEAHRLLTGGVVYCKIHRGMSLCRGTFGDGRSTGCPLTMAALLLYEVGPWEGGALHRLYDHLGWSTDAAMAFVAGFDGTEDPRRDRFPEHAQLGERIAKELGVSRG